MKSLHDYGDNWEGFLQCPDDVWFFTKGACHAFAIELQSHFCIRGCQPELHYACGDESVDSLRHVFVKAATFYWDVTGRHTLVEIAMAWANGNESRILPLGDDYPIFRPTLTPDMSYFGMNVNPTFLDYARKRARTFIARNIDRFDLPEHVQQSTPCMRTETNGGPP